MKLNDESINQKEEQPCPSYAPNKLQIVMQTILVGTLFMILILGSLKALPETVSANTTVNGRELPIYCVDTQEKKIALSFDAAWGNEDTQTILDILKKHDVHVTFFMTGGWVESYPEDVKAIAAAGHDLGNHSENHKEMSKLGTAECSDELMKVHNKVKELTGQDMVLFRPPYGDYNNNLITTATGCGYYTVQWSIDSLDWKNYGVEDIINRVLNHKNLENGAIVLMHNGAKYTAQALDAVITGLKEKGYTLVPISELIYTENFHMDAAGKQHSDAAQSQSTAPAVQ